MYTHNSARNSIPDVVDGHSYNYPSSRSPIIIVLLTHPLMSFASRDDFSKYHTHLSALIVGCVTGAHPPPLLRSWKLARTLVAVATVACSHPESSRDPALSLEWREKSETADHRTPLGTRFTLSRARGGFSRDIRPNWQPEAARNWTTKFRAYSRGWWQNIKIFYTSRWRIRFDLL